MAADGNLVDDEPEVNLNENSESDLDKEMQK